MKRFTSTDNFVRHNVRTLITVLISSRGILSFEFKTRVNGAAAECHDSVTPWPAWQLWRNLRYLVSRSLTLSCDVGESSPDTWHMTGEERRCQDCQGRVNMGWVIRDGGPGPELGMCYLVTRWKRPHALMDVGSDLTLWKSLWCECFLSCTFNLKFIFISSNNCCTVSSGFELFSKRITSECDCCSCSETQCGVQAEVTRWLWRSCVLCDARCNYLTN